MVDSTLFNSEDQIHNITDIHDPDDPTNSGLVVPQVGDLVYEKSGNSVTYYTVIAVDENNKSTLGNPNIVENGDNSVTSIVDYANTRFHVYYDDRVEPTKLNIDSLLTIFGINNTEYILKRETVDGEEEIVSVYYDSDNEYNGNRIPLKLDASTQTKYCTSCHTLLILEDNEKITMEIYDNAGTMSAEVTLFAKRAVILNDMDTSKIITDFQLTSVQETDDVIQLYEKQDASALCLTPTVIYNDGTKEVIPVDDERCFLYGLEDVIGSYPGLRQSILCKYFLKPSQLSEIAIDDTTGRCIAVEREIIVLGNAMSFGVKLSILPIWSFTLSRYELKFWLYSTERDISMDVTDHVELLTEFDGADFNSVQALQYSIDLSELFEFDGESTYVQYTWLRLNQWSLTVERYIIKDTENDDYAFGVDSSSYRRPAISYDEDREQYFIPTSVFENSAAFIEAAYTRSHPLYDARTEIEPVTPTHFTVRNPITGNTVISSPIPIDEYNQAWSITTSGLANQFLNQVLIIEFLYYSSDTYQILYGTPCDIYTGTYSGD